MYIVIIPYNSIKINTVFVIIYKISFYLKKSRQIQGRFPRAAENGGFRKILLSVRVAVNTNVAVPETMDCCFNKIPALKYVLLTPRLSRGALNKKTAAKNRRFLYLYDGHAVSLW